MNPNHSVSKQDLEKLMRKLEIGRFWAKSEAEWPTPILLDTSLRFCAHFDASGDARFLSTAFKLIEVAQARLGRENEAVRRAEAAAESSFQILRKTLGLK